MKIDRFVSIDNNTDYILDTASGAYLSTDKAALLERKYKRKLQETIISMQAEINTLKHEIEKLKITLNGK